MVHIAARPSDGLLVSVAQGRGGVSRYVLVEQEDNTNQDQDTKSEKFQQPSWWRRWWRHLLEALKFPSPLGPMPPIRAPWVFRPA